MSDVETGSDIENYYDAEEFDDFIDYGDEEVTKIKLPKKHETIAGQSADQPIEIDHDKGSAEGGVVEEEE